MAEVKIKLGCEFPGLSQIKDMANTVTSFAVLIDGETVATGQTDSQIVAALDVSACRAFYLVSDQDVTFETNSGSAAADTIALKANYPYVWVAPGGTVGNAYDSFLLGTDVTSVFITNASGSTAKIYMAAGTDATP